MKPLKLSEIAEKMKLKSLACEDKLASVDITIPEINRPALQLAGFLAGFPAKRIQIIGNIEYNYLSHLSEEERYEGFRGFVSAGIPCVIFTNSLKPWDDILKLAEDNEVPVLSCANTTSDFSANLTLFLCERLAPSTNVHGVMMDIFGEGVLITGESGIGKSEAALELIKRGHRLISDDIVEISRISEETLMGESPDITRHFIELRGVGIIDVKMLFGVESVENTHSIDLVIHLEDWQKDKEYDRLGLEDEYTDILGVNVPSHRIPIRPGRNIAIIVETAAVNHRQKKMGYNAAKEMHRRVQENINRERH